MSKDDVNEGALRIAAAFEFVLNRDSIKEMESSREHFMACCLAYFENSKDFRTIAFAMNNHASYLMQRQDLWDEVVDAMENENVPQFALDKIKSDCNESLAAKVKKEKTASKTRVYLMRNERNGLIKIGHSTNPKSREATLQSEEPEVSLIKHWDATTRDELMLHGLYEAHRVRGEWFKLTPDHINEIEEIMEAAAL